MKKRFMSIMLILCMVLTLLPTEVFATGWTTNNTIFDGWYHLRCMNNYLNLTADGDAELRKLSENQAFYVESKGGSQYILKMKDGRYLGLEGERKDGARVKAVNTPYIWLIHWEATNFNKEKSDIFSLRPPEASKMIVNASGEKNADGTSIIIWKNAKLDAPNHAEFRFIPITTSDPTGERWTVYKENGMMGYKDQSGKVMIKAQFDDAEKFSQGIARVYDKKKGAAAYIDTTGKLITPFKYYSAASGHISYDGLMRVAIYGDDVVNAIMNGDGVEYTDSIGSNTVVVMSSGKKLKFDPKYGFIDKTGKEVIPLQFDEAYSFQDGMAAVLQSQGWQYGFVIHKIGYIDTTGKLVIPYKYGGDNLYDGNALSYKDGLTCFFEYLGKEGVSADGWVKHAPGGIMDKTGKVIVPSNPDRYYWSNQFGLQWRDGVIVNSYFTEVNKEGIPTKGGGKEWSFTELYDYSGKLIRKLEGYVEAMPLGGGYTLALHQLPTDAPVNIGGSMHIPGFWTVFDRTGKIVVDDVQKNNFSLLNSAYGYANGYVYFGGEGYKVSETPAPVTTMPKSKTTATPSKTSFVMSSKPVSVTAAYTINSTNYLQLRAIAVMLNGTAAQFDVGWDGQFAVIEPGKPYSGTITETKLQITTNVRESRTKFKLDGEVFTFSDARLIDGDTNYLQLREFAQKLSGTASQFNVYWDGVAGQAVIQPGLAYTGSAS